MNETFNLDFDFNLQDYEVNLDVDKQSISLSWLEIEFDQTLTGGQDDDLLEGGGQNDWIRGFGGNDTLNGLAGTDSLKGGEDDDILDGGSGNDTLIGDSGSFGLAKLDDGVFLSVDTGGGRGNDFLNGGDGNDALDGGGGNDTIIGGEGDDALFGGTDIAPLAFGSFVRRSDGSGNDYLDAGAGNDDVVGAGGNDTLIGGSGKDFLLGDDGSDRLVGDDGNDTLEGGANSDTLTGGSGADGFRFGFTSYTSYWYPFEVSGQPTPLPGIDLVEDYNAAEGDQLIISAPDSIVVDQLQYNSETGSLSYNGEQFAQLPTGLDFVPQQDLVLDLYPAPPNSFGSVVVEPAMAGPLETNGTLSKLAESLIG